MLEWMALNLRAGSRAWVSPHGTAAYYTISVRLWEQVLKPLGGGEE